MTTATPDQDIMGSENELLLSNLFAVDDDWNALSSMEEMDDFPPMILDDEEPLAIQNNLDDVDGDRKPSPMPNPKRPASVTPNGGCKKLKKMMEHRPRLSRRRKKTKSKLPKRPLSAYGLFYQQEHQKALQKFRGETNMSGEEVDLVEQDPTQVEEEELQKWIGKRWRTLPAEDRAYYEERAVEERRRYQQEMAVYKPMTNKGDSNSKASSCCSSICSQGQEREQNKDTKMPAPSSIHRRVSVVEGDEPVSQQGDRKAVSPTSHVILPSTPSSPTLPHGNNHEIPRKKDPQVAASAEARAAPEDTEKQEQEDVPTSPFRPYTMTSPPPYYPHLPAWPSSWEGCQHHSPNTTRYPPTVVQSAPPPLPTMVSPPMRGRGLRPLASYQQDYYPPATAAVVPPSPCRSSDIAAPMARRCWVPPPPPPPPPPRWCVPPGMHLHLPGPPTTAMENNGQYLYHGHRRYQVQYVCYRMPREAVPAFMEQLQWREHPQHMQQQQQQQQGETREL